MPELPEVETVREGLARLLVGHLVLGVSYDWDKGFPNYWGDVEASLIGAEVIDVRRRAKVLIIDLDTKFSLVIHLKMTGQLVYVRRNMSKEYGIKNRVGPARASDSPFEIQNSDSEERFGAGHPNDSLIGQLPDKSTRVIFRLDRGARLFFNDQRKFGWVRLLPTIEVSEIDFFKKFGPEPLDGSFTAEAFITRLGRRKHSNIKSVLLDQSIIAGVGNIYADESLFAACIHPAEVVENITDARKAVLFGELQRILILAIEKGGSSDRNYIDAEGKKGSYLSFAQVFRREGQPCLRCGTTIVKTRVAGRGTHTCPNCQKLKV